MKELSKSDINAVCGGDGATKENAIKGGAVAGATVGGCIGGPVGAMVGAAVGGIGTAVLITIFG